MFDVSQVVGIGGAPVVVSLVNMIKDLGLPKKYAAIVSLIIAVLFNVFLAFALKNDLFSAVVIGVLTGGVASGYYDATN